MDTVHPDEPACILPSARELLLNVEDRPVKPANADSPTDKMLIDEPYESAEPRPFLSPNRQDSGMKPRLHPTNDAQPYSPIPHSSSTVSPSSSLTTQQASDEYIRHRMSDMTVSATSPSQHRPLTATTRGSPQATSPATQEQAVPRTLSPLEPTTQPYYESLSRRASVTDPALHSNNNNAPPPPLEFRRPSITELNSLPLPASSANVSRRGSVATVVTEYDYSSRSPSPAAFGKQQQSSLRMNHEMDYTRRDSLPHPAVAHAQNYDLYQRRHSIATAEVPNSRLGHSGTRYRGFRFPDTIPEAPNHGPYSAPSSPPQSASSSSNNTSSLYEHPSNAMMPETFGRYSRHGPRYASAPGNDHHYHYLQRHGAHPYGMNGPTSSAALNGNGGGPVIHHRRRSILMEEGVNGDLDHVLARRASMPVVGVNGNQHPPDSLQNNSYHGNTMMQQQREEEKPAPRKSETPYSRSPELRVSHKLAERKRRKEMKELFDELRDSLPVEKNLKTSKWEILSKAVEYITLLKRRDFEMESEVTALRREVNRLKQERGISNGYGPPY